MASLIIQTLMPPFYGIMAMYTEIIIIISMLDHFPLAQPMMVVVTDIPHQLSLVSKIRILTYNQ